MQYCESMQLLWKRVKCDDLQTSSEGIKMKKKKDKDKKKEEKTKKRAAVAL